MSKTTWLRFLPLALFAVLVAAFGAALMRGDNHKFAQHLNDPTPVTQLAPALGKGDGFSTDAWKGKPYIVNFFASWCAPCHSEHEALMRLALHGIPVIGLAYKDKPEAVAAFLDKDGNPYHAVALDSTGRTGIDWGITGVPETFVIDAQGIIRYHSAAPLTETVIRHEIMPLWKSLNP